jgi:hypothetical protein
MYESFQSYVEIRNPHTLHYTAHCCTTCVLMILCILNTWILWLLGAPRMALHVLFSLPPVPVTPREVEAL